MGSSQKILSSLRKAHQFFQIAENEFYRPNEDAVVICACQQMRNSVDEFLRSYLMSKAIQPTDGSYFYELLQICKATDPQFKAIDLSCFSCNHESEYSSNDAYCLSTNKMTECFKQTQMVKNLVLEKLHVSEKEL